MDATIQGIRIKFLVDCGSDISIVKPAIFNLIPNDQRPAIYAAQDDVEMADGSKLPTNGIGLFTLNIENRTLQQNIWLSDIEEEGILGWDFLTAYGCVIDAANKKLIIGKQPTPLSSNQVQPETELPKKPSVCRVRVKETVIIPPSSETIIPAQLSDTLETSEGLILPKPQFVDKFEVLVASSVVNTRNETVPLRLLNPSPNSITLYKGTVAAFCEVGEVVNQQTPMACNAVQKSANEEATNPSKALNATTDKANEDIPDFLQDCIARACENVECEKQKQQIRQLFKDYSTLFAESSFDLGRTNIVEHTIDVGDARPIRQPPRRKPLHLRAEEERQVKEMLQKGIISPSSSPWSSATVLVKKKSGDWRLAIDYRQVNQVSKKDSYPLPNIADHLDALGGSKWFSTLDLASGFWQVGMVEKDKEITAFSAGNGGLYQFNVMPFGLCNAAATFARVMERTLAGLNWNTCLVYLDDIIVPAPSFDEAITRIRAVFTRLQETGLKLSPKKCHLFKKQVEYLGHVVSEEGVKTDPQKISAVRGWPTPTTVSEVKSFVGMASYYRRYVRGFAEIAKPLHRLGEKQKPFQWTEECEDAFNSLKVALTSAPILAFPTTTDKFILDTDASHFACGAVLSQIQDSEEKVIAYFSKSFSKEQRRYCVTRKELLAIVEAIKHFRHYLFGREFTIRTDHHALQWLRQFKHAEGQLARWIQRLETYHGTIIHRAGKLHQNADGMSRRPCRECRHCDRKEDVEKEARSKCYDHDHEDEPGMVESTYTLTTARNTLKDEDRPAATASVLKFSSKVNILKSEIHNNQVHSSSSRTDDRKHFVSMLQTIHEESDQNVQSDNEIDEEVDDVVLSEESIRKAQQDDPDIGPMIQWKKRSNSRPSWKDISATSRSTKSYWAQWDRMELRNDILYRRWESAVGDEVHWQLVIPRELKSKVLHQLHDTKTAGHLGSKKTQSRLSKRFYWHGSISDVERWCRSCDICASRKRPHKTPRAPMQTYTVGAPMERVALDILGPLPETNSGNKYILVIGDYFTKWTEAYAMPNQEAITVARIVVEEFVCRFGVPRQLHSDQGTNFQSALFREMCRLLDCDQTRTSPFHPISDGMIERFNQTAEAMISKFVSANQRDWDEHLPFLMMAYRTAEHDSTKIAPAEAMLGRQTEIPIDLVVGPPPGDEDKMDLPEYVQKLKDKIEYTHDVIRKSSIIATDTQKRSYDHRVTKEKYKVGDAVWLHNPARRRGLSPKLSRPWEGPFTVTAKLSDVTFRIQKSARSRPKVVHSNRLKPYEGRYPPTWFKQPSLEDVQKNKQDATVQTEEINRTDTAIEGDDDSNHNEYSSNVLDDNDKLEDACVDVSGVHDQLTEYDDHIDEMQNDSINESENHVDDRHNQYNVDTGNCRPRRSNRRTRHPDRYNDFVLLHDTECNSDEWESSNEMNLDYCNNQHFDGDDEESPSDTDSEKEQTRNQRSITRHFQNKKKNDERNQQPNRRSKRISRQPDRFQV